jgi:hypothetical protein
VPVQFATNGSLLGLNIPAQAAVIIEKALPKQARSFVMDVSSKIGIVRGAGIHNSADEVGYDFFRAASHATTYTAPPYRRQPRPHARIFAAKINKKRFMIPPP